MYHFELYRIQDTARAIGLSDEQYIDAIRRAQIPVISLADKIIYLTSPSHAQIELYATTDSPQIDFFTPQRRLQFPSSTFVNPNHHSFAYDILQEACQLLTAIGYHIAHEPDHVTVTSPLS